MFAYLNIIQSAHKKFLGPSWLAYDIDFRRRAAQDPTLTWRKIHPQLYLEKFTGLSRSACFNGVGLTTCVSPALYLPVGITQAQSVTPAGTSTGELPASGPLAPTSTVAQLITATKPILQPHTPASALSRLQSQMITSVNDFLTKLKPHTPVNVDILESYLEGHPDPQFVNCFCSGLREGFHIGYSGPRTHSFYPNLRSANLHPDILEQNLLTEVLNGQSAGPFLSPPFINFPISPLGLVPKKHSNKWRTIFHLLYPKNSSTSINANIPIEDYTLQMLLLIMPSISSSPLGRVPLCPRQTFSLPFT